MSDINSNGDGIQPKPVAPLPGWLTDPDMVVAAVSLECHTHVDGTMHGFLITDNGEPGTRGMIAEMLFPSLVEYEIFSDLLRHGNLMMDPL